MNPIVYINSNILNYYENDSFIGRIKDRLKISLVGESFIKELNLSVANIKLPPNFNRNAYINNVTIARKMIKNRKAALAPKTYRYLDYEFYNEFQKKLMAFSVVKSSQLVLRTNMKSLRDSCIVVYDAAENIILETIKFIAKECKYIILVSEDIHKIINISEYIMASYGVTPIITKDKNYAFKCADVVVNSRGENIFTNGIVWHFDNIYNPSIKKGLYVNDVTYKTPWNDCNLEISSELLGAILCQMEEKDIESSLKYNDIWIDKIRFNDSTIGSN